MAPVSRTWDGCVEDFLKLPYPYAKGGKLTAGTGRL